MDKLFEIKKIKEFVYIRKIRFLDIYDFEVTTRDESNAVFFITDQEWQVENGKARLGIKLKDELIKEIKELGFESLLFSGEVSAYERSDIELDTFKEQLEANTESTKDKLIKKIEERIDAGIQQINNNYINGIVSRLLSDPEPEIKTEVNNRLDLSKLVGNKDISRLLKEVEGLKVECIINWIKTSELECKNEIIENVKKRSKILCRFL